MRACFLPLLNQVSKVKTAATTKENRNQMEKERPIDEEKFYKNDTSLKWDKRSTITIDKSIDSTYWLQSTFLGRINGVVYRNYLNFVEDYLVDKGKYFIPQSICSNADKESCFTLSSTGDTFVAASLTLFAGLSVNLHAIIPPRASAVRLLSFVEPYLFSLSDLNHTSSQNDNMAVTVPVRDSELEFGTILERNERLKKRNLRDILNMYIEFDQEDSKMDSDHAHMDGERIIRLLDEDSPTIIDQDNDTTDDLVANNSTVVPSPGPSLNASAPVNSTLHNEGNSTTWFNEQKSEEHLFNTTNFKDVAITEYYMLLIICMRGYQLEYFADALKSCLTEDDGFIHIEGERYYHIRPRHPFVFNHDYWQDVPLAIVLEKTGQDISDIVISLAILVITIIGLTMGLWKLKILDILLERYDIQMHIRTISTDKYLNGYFDINAEMYWLWYIYIHTCIYIHRSNWVWKQRVTAKAPSEGGYSSQASELPMYKLWGGRAIVHNTSYRQLQTEDLDEDWVESCTCCILTLVSAFYPVFVCIL
jgi:hypothetical protein